MNEVLGNTDRYFMVSGWVDGGMFSVTVVSRLHVSIFDIGRCLRGWGFEGLDLKVGSIYEFRDRLDYDQYKVIDGESD
jgi:hypothetical protein